MVTAPTLVAPRASYRDDFLEAVEEFGDEETLIYERELAQKDFHSYLRRVIAWERGRRLPHGWVPCTTRWLVDDGGYIGTVNVRHELTEWLLRIGGHVGYAIRPARRGEGHGTLICRLGLDVCREIGLGRVLITCDDDNEASRRIIERNGGVLEDVVPQPDRDVAKRRYWVDLG
jgi:predicted acetyltransferase